MTDFTVTVQRGEAISFSHPVTQVYFSLYIQNPSGGTLNYMAYIEPMNHMVWLCVIIFCILTPLILCLITQYVSFIVQYSPHIFKKLQSVLCRKIVVSFLNSCFQIYHSRYGERDLANHEFTFGKSAVFVLSSLTLRGWSDTPITAAGRIAFIM